MRQGRHGLLPCCASLALDQSVSRVVMDLLGHSWISGAIDTYHRAIAAMVKDPLLAVGQRYAEGR